MSLLPRSFNVRTTLVVTATVAALCVPTVVVRAVTIDTVPVGNPGNPADLRFPFSINKPNGYDGSVTYPFRMGKTEVTNAQYVQFLNAAARSDPYGLYNDMMYSYTRGGIVQFGLPGVYSYDLKPSAVGQGPGGSDYAYADKPVVYISWYDAIRFANWLHNGQGSGDTETGAYTLLGGIPVPSNADSITRNPGARWFLPTRDEWYKAAYYDPDSGTYYDYPTRSNSVPDNNLPSADTGNSANFWSSGGNYTTGNGSYPMTDAGAYALSPGPYGTFDQGGNVREWNELFYASQRGNGGGTWNHASVELAASNFSVSSTEGGSEFTGFRVATVVPEPSTLALAALALAPFALRRVNPRAAGAHPQRLKSTASLPPPCG